MQKLLLVYYHSENRTTSQIWKVLPNMVFPPIWGGGGNGGVLSMRMQVILDSSFARPSSAPIWGGKKGEFRDWTKVTFKLVHYAMLINQLRFGLTFFKVLANFRLTKTGWIVV